MMNCTRPKSSAFTLVEVLVVVVIIGICATIVVPAIGTHDDQNVASAARSLAADIIFAQNRAILSQSFRYLKFDSVGQSYSIRTNRPDITPAAYETNPTTMQNYIANFGSAAPPGGMQMVQLQSPNVDTKTCIAFDELGQPYSCDASSGATVLLINPATFPIRSGTITLTVTVDPYTGAVSVQ